MAKIDEQTGGFSANWSELGIQKLLLVFIPGILLWSSCVSEKPQLLLKEYYFPVESLENGLVYEYVPVSGDSLGSEYWFYKSIKDEGGWHFTGTFYDEYFQVRQFFREDVFDNGTLMIDHFLYQPDSTGQSIRFPAQVRNPNGFPFELMDSSSVLLFELAWTFSESPLHRVTLTRNRQYREKGDFSFEGKETPIVIFDLKEKMDDEREGHLEKEYSGLEIYGKGIGLVYYRKDIGQGLNLEYQLKERYTMEQFEDKFKAYIN
ncbi:MAG: hypothetical protein HKN16_05610 [Saprospiraceae bacterium]|nr:hypothetical protein [Saprospiraceae bacterium]